MVKRRLTVWSMVAAASLLGGTLALAANNAPPGPPPSAKPGPGMLGGPKDGGPRAAERRERREMLREALKGLNLTEDQKAQLKQIREDFHSQVEKFRSEHQDEINQLRQQMKEAKENKDWEKSREAMSKLRQLMEQGPKPHELLDKIKNILTPEQKTQLVNKLKQLCEEDKDSEGPGKKHPGGRRGPGGPPDGPGEPGPGGNNPPPPPAPEQN